MANFVPNFVAMARKFFSQQDNVHTNTESVQCISIVYRICLYKYNQLAV